MVLHFEKRMVKTGAILGDTHKGKYAVNSPTGFAIEFECMNLSAAFMYDQIQFVIKPLIKFFNPTKHLLFKENDSNPVAELKMVGWSFFKPYIPYLKCRDGKKYFFHQLQKQHSYSLWKGDQGGYYEVCLKDAEHSIICAYKFKKVKQIARGILAPDPVIYLDLEGIIELEESDYILAVVGLFFIEYMLSEDANG